MQNDKENVKVSVDIDFWDYTHVVLPVILISQTSLVDHVNFEHVHKPISVNLVPYDLQIINGKRVHSLSEITDGTVVFLQAGNISAGKIYTQRGDPP